jgi:quercetin dioxygenase-like cupin family protein
MDTSIEKSIAKTSQMNWKPLAEEGIDTKGIFVKILRFDEKNQRPPSFLLKFEAGAKYPYHNHPGGEEAFVLEGSCYFNNALLNAGDYLYTPPNFKHAVKTDTGCVLLFMVPEEVEIIKQAI